MIPVVETKDGTISVASAFAAHQEGNYNLIGPDSVCNVVLFSNNPRSTSLGHKKLLE